MKIIKELYLKLISYMKMHAKMRSIQMTIVISFTIISACTMGLLSVTLYSRFVKQMQGMMVESAEQLLNQTSIKLETYLRGMRRISDAMYYSVIKNTDLAVDSMDAEMNLLYEANKDNLISIACYTNDGRLVAAAPVATEKENPDITNQKWFVDAMDQMENIHFYIHSFRAAQGTKRHEKRWLVAVFFL